MFRETSHVADIPYQRTSYKNPPDSNMGAEHGLVIEASLPGDPCVVRRFYFHLSTSTGGTPLPEAHSYSDIGCCDSSDSSSSSDIGEAEAIMVHDPFHINCAIKDEIVSYQWDHQRKQFIFVGQHGLVRRAQLIESIPAGTAGQATLRDAQTAMVVLEIENETSEDLDAGSTIWVSYIAGSEDLIYDSTGVLVGPPDPTPIRAGKWVPISAVGSSLVRFILLEPLTVCGQALANIMDCECDALTQITVVDSAGLATLEMDRTTGAEMASSGSVGWAKFRACGGSSSSDSGSSAGPDPEGPPGTSAESSSVSSGDDEYDIVSIGIGCCGSSGSSSSECLQLPGIIMDDIPIVMPVAGQDYVLGYQDGCLVRFPIAACRQDSGSGSV